MAAIKPGELNLVQQMLGLKASSYPDEFKDICFVCIDIEAFEFAQEKITEIGVSVLDMRDVQQPTTNLILSLRYAHYRISGYGHLVNKRWVKGCPEDFSFGRSVWINGGEAKGVLERICRDPGRLGVAHQSEGGVEERKVVIVGHGLGNDADYLKHLKFNLNGLTNVVAKVDTQRLCSAKKHPLSLVKLLKALDVEPHFLHNAGNDAAYTMQALIMMAVKEFNDPGRISFAIKGQQVKAERVPKEAKEPKPKKRERKEAKRLYREAEAHGKATEGVEKSAGTQVGS